MMENPRSERRALVNEIVREDEMEPRTKIKTSESWGWLIVHLSTALLYWMVLVTQLEYFLMLYYRTLEEVVQKHPWLAVFKLVSIVLVVL